ncbi:UDP-N-acetylglucosamine diphosphorylase, partial [Pseudomonas sp. GP01-A5]
VGPIIIACGDTPLVGHEAFETLIASHRQSGAVATLASAFFENPFGYGRIVRDSDGSVAAIVEHRDASDSQRQIKEI